MQPAAWHNGWKVAHVKTRCETAQHWARDVACFQKKQNKTKTLAVCESSEAPGTSQQKKTERTVAIPSNYKWQLLTIRVLYPAKPSIKGEGRIRTLFRHEVLKKCMPSILSRCKPRQRKQGGESRRREKWNTGNRSSREERWRDSQKAMREGHSKISLVSGLSSPIRDRGWQEPSLRSTGFGSGHRVAGVVACKELTLSATLTRYHNKKSICVKHVSELNLFPALEWLKIEP